MEYIYTPLPSGEIRLVDIEPARDLKTPLRCHMWKQIVGPVPEAATKNSLPTSHKPYYTLSYAWGPTFPDGSHLTDSIDCDGMRLRITRNLHDALKRIRKQMFFGNLSSWDGRYATWDGRGISTTNKITLWVDAICINQEDLDERAEQVRRMGDIFSCSSRLLIWLGEFADDSADWLRLRQLFEDLRDLGGSQGFYANQTMEECADILLRQAWFSRRWVMLEYTLSKRYHERAPIFLICAFVFGDRKLRQWLPAKRMEDHGLLSTVRALGSDLLHEMYVRRDLQCTDNRDRLYALAAICEDGQELPIDYKISAKDVYQSFALHNARRSFESLALLLVLAVLCRNEKWPSWVPDWTLSRRFQWRERATIDRLAIGLYHRHPSPLVRCEGNALLIEGVCIRPCYPPKHRRFSDEPMESLSFGEDFCWSCQENIFPDSMPVEFKEHLMRLDSMRSWIVMLPRQGAHEQLDVLRGVAFLLEQAQAFEQSPSDEAYRVTAFIPYWKPSNLSRIMLESEGKPRRVWIV